MPVPSAISDLNQTPGLNPPAGSESPALLDDYHRTTFAFIAKLRDGQGFSNPVDLASGATTDIGAQTSHVVRITGTTTITSFGANYNGPRFLVFGGALTLTHNATSLILPGGANITTTAGDSCVAVPNLSAPTGWRVLAYQRASGEALAIPDNSVSTAKIQDAAVTLAKLNSTALAALNVPAGFCLPFAGTSAPSGWLALPTTPTNISRATYAALFAAIGTTWGAGDGSTTFGMPYMPTNFAAVQANGNVGTETVGQVITHSHDLALLGSDGVSATARSGSAAAAGTAQTAATGGSANLAAGIRLLWCVKT